MKEYERQLRTEYLSKENCDCAKGVFSILVVMHHLSQNSGVVSGIHIVQEIFSEIGPLSVSVFFFFSGYGLAVSCEIAGERYVRNFPRNKLLPFYEINVLLIFVYVMYDFLVKGNISPALVFQSFLFGGTVIANGWYIQTQMLLYSYFYLIFRFFKSGLARYVCLFAVVGLQCIILYSLNFGLWWVRSCPDFLLGFLWFANQDTVNKIIRSRSKWLLSLIASLSCFVPGVVLSRVLHGYVRIPFFLLYDLCFVVSVILLISRIRIVCGLTICLGKLSFGIYVIHGLFISLFHGRLNISNDVIYCVVVFVATLVTAVPLKIITDRVYGAARKKTEQAEH